MASKILMPVNRPDDEAGLGGGLQPELSLPRREGKSPWLTDNEDPGL